MRRWLEIAVVVPAGAADVVADRLVERGAPGIREEEVAGDAEHRRIVVHFPEGASVESVARELVLLEPHFPGTAGAPIASRVVDEEDWADGWRRSFPPLEIGHRLRVRPPWEAAPADGRIDVVIEPAMAFGTGQHESTHGCLLAIEVRLAPGAAGAAVLDIGTGSAILAIAALKLGAARAVGVDTDAIAIAAARENALRNGVADSLVLAVGGVESVGGTFDLVLANLYSGVLARIMPELASRLRPRAALVLSGLLAADTPEVVRRGSECGLTLAGERTIAGWTTLVLGNADATAA